MLIIVTLLQYILIGALAGALAGLLGVGGAIILVPGLVWIFSTQTTIPALNLMHFVVGTSFAASVVTTLFSLRAQYHRGTVSWPLFLQLLPGMVLGVVVGAILASFLRSHILQWLFGVFMILVSAQMFFRYRERQEFSHPSKLSRWIVSVCIGMFSGLLGISGSALTIPYLSYYKTPIRQAMGAATACGVVITTIGSISFMITGLQDRSAHAIRWSTGYVYWPAVLSIALATPWFATIGAAWSNQLPVERLRYIFAGFLLLVGLHMLLHQS